MGDERSANSVDKTIGERVRARRVQIGLTQEKLADLLGVTFQQVQKYETGANRIAASRLYHICVALEAPVTRFYPSLEAPRRGVDTPPRIDEWLVVPGVIDLVRLFVSIENDRVRRRVLDLVRTIAVEDG